MSVKPYTTRYRPELRWSLRWSIPVAADDTEGVVPDMVAGAAGRYALPPRKPVTFRPSRVAVQYLREGDAPAQVTVTVSGPKVKKDGTCGYGNGSTTFTMPEQRADLPDWLAELVADDIGVVIDVHHPL